MDSTQLICIVDDSADYRFVVQQIFMRFLPLYPIRLFSGGQALLEELPKVSPSPSLILLDRHMPGLDGHQTLLLLKQHPVYRTIPVVMMSAGPTAAEIEGCYQAGVNSFLLKSLDLERLKQTLSTVCQYWLELNQQANPELSNRQE